MSRFKWPPSVLPAQAAHTLCSMLDSGTLQLHPTEQPTRDKMSTGSTKGSWLRQKGRATRGSERHTEGDDCVTLDWQEHTPGAKWKQSGVSPKDLLQLVHVMREGGIRPDRLVQLTF